MEIKNMRKISNPNSKIKATFSIDTKNFTINDMKLVEGERGIFATFPSREYTNNKGEKKYISIVWCKDTDFIKAVSEEAVKVYNGGPEPDNSDIPF